MVTRSPDSSFGISGNHLDGSGSSDRLYLQRNCFVYGSMEDRVTIRSRPKDLEVTTYVHDGVETISAFLNGVLQGSEPHNPVMPAIGEGHLAMPFQAGGKPHMGELFEVIIYNRRLTSTERQKAEEYLLAKYGMQKTELISEPAETDRRLWLRSDVLAESLKEGDLVKTWPGNSDFKAKVPEGRREKFRRFSTREILQSTAYSYLERGADGISLFNFVYSRKRDREPLFDAIHNITDREFLAKQEKHYFIGINHGASRRWSKQLPARLDGEKSCALRIHVADADPESTFSRAILRLQSDTPIESRNIQAYCLGHQLAGTIHPGELFVQPYHQGVPKTHTWYKDFLVPLNLVMKGWNVFEFRLLDDGEPVELIRMELALYH
jgi:hypothetical protein